MKTKHNKLTTTITTLILILLYSIDSNSVKREPFFNKDRAFKDIIFQTSLGARTIGSTAHQKVREWIYEELRKYGWLVEDQFVAEDIEIHNIIARRGSGYPWIILGAHYDSRFLADRDPNLEKRSQPVIGANDGASGVAVLLELGRIIPIDIENEVWLVFFDAEDNGKIFGYDWIMGSQAFVKRLKRKPDAAIIVDMVGDANLDVYYEANSNVEISVSIWNKADELGFHQFIPALKHRLVDDHIPFIEAGIPAIDIIDFDYPYWHTSEDTIDKLSADSLHAVGQTLLSWLIQSNKLEWK